MITNSAQQKTMPDLGKVTHIDYKDIELLKKFTSYYGKIEPGVKTGLNRKQQTRLARAIKRARYMAMLPYYIQ